MPLEHGKYGVEYDGARRSSGGKLWLLPVVIPVIVILLVLRGCLGEKSGGVYSVAIDEPPAPDLEVVRERPSIMAHFVESWKSKFRGDRQTGSDGEIVNEDSGEIVGVDEHGTFKKEDQEKSRDSKIPPDVERLIRRADELTQGGDYMSARMILEKLRLRPGAEAVRGLIEKRIGEINVSLIFSGNPMPGKLLHTVKSGDLISRMARNYKTTQEYILYVNSIDRPEKIRINQELWVLDNPIFELMIDKSDYKAVLLFNNRFFKVYTVGLGDPAGVPAGSYVVKSRGSSANTLDETLYGISLEAAGDTPSINNLRLQAAENDSMLGRNAECDGILFRASEMKELYLLLPYGAMVTIVP